MTFSLFWDVTRPSLVVGCRSFGPTYWFLPKGTAWTLKMELICCPETSVTSYPLNHISEERTQLHRSGNLKSRVTELYLV